MGKRKNAKASIDAFDLCHCETCNGVRDNITQEEYVPMNLRDYSRRVIQRVIPSYKLVFQEEK